MPVVTHSINNAMKQNKGANLAYFHTMQDRAVNGFVKSAINGIYKPDCEEALALLLASVCIKREQMPNALREQIERYERKEMQTITKEVKKKVKVKELDAEGNAVLDEAGNEKFKEVEEVEKIKEEIEVTTSVLYDYCGSSIRDSIEEVKKALEGAKNPILVVGFDIYRAKNAENIAKILGAIESLSQFKIMLLPPTTNALGISLICELDKEGVGYSIGYNVAGNYRIGTGAENALHLPYLNEQEGTFVNVDKRVVPIAPATPYSGYELNDIARALGLEYENTIDYTQELPLEKGFKSIEYDALQFGFLNDGSEIRGYLLGAHFPKETLEVAPIELEELESYNLYARNPMAHFSKSTLASLHIDSKNGLQLSEKYAQMLGISEGDKVEVRFANGEVVEVLAILDKGMEGEFGALGVCGFEESALFPTTRYANVSLKVLV